MARKEEEAEDDDAATTELPEAGLRERALKELVEEAENEEAVEAGLPH